MIRRKPFTSLFDCKELCRKINISSLVLILGELSVEIYMR